MEVKEMVRRSRPFVAVILLQVGFAGMDVLSKIALDRGMNNYAFVAYRHVVATVVVAPLALFLEKKVRPRMTISVFTKILLLSLLEPVIDQNLYFLGMKLTSATFAASLGNMLPAVTFLMACIFRLEKVEIKSVRSQAKLVGTCITIGGAMVMTLVRGPTIIRGWLHHTTALHEPHKTNNISLHDTIKGSIMITTSCFGWASFFILQAVTLKAYPAELSLTAWICLLGSIWNVIVGLIVEGGKAKVWSIHFDIKLLASVYSGIFCSGLAYYVQGVIMKDRGPVFVTMFSPLCMVFVAVMSFFFLGEQVNLGRAVGSMVIVAGLYLVVWGKAKDDDESTHSATTGATPNQVEGLENKHPCLA